METPTQTPEGCVTAEEGVMMSLGAIIALRCMSPAMKDSYPRRIHHLYIQEQNQEMLLRMYAKRASFSQRVKNIIKELAHITLDPSE